uniref:Glutamine amidotransferase domain-containing protein n=1 Tax=uncultured bacterium BAC17H8 TaxID=332980 RepID=Q4JMP9_9BACT|nr:unknown [uncultured bacterium BAC17H8]
MVTLKRAIGLTGTYTHRVNSYHEYAPDQLPGCMDPIAVAEDGNVEAIKHKIMPIEGWMWHPERSEENRGLHSCLIKSKLQI